MDKKENNYLLTVLWSYKYPTFVFLIVIAFAAVIFKFGLYTPYKDIFSIIEHVGTFAAAIFALVVISKMTDQLDEMRKQRKELELQREEITKPELIVTLVPDEKHFGILHIYLENIGQGIAKNVEVRFAKDGNCGIKDDITHQNIAEYPIFNRTINFLAPNQKKLLFTINAYENKDIWEKVFKFNLNCEGYPKDFELDMCELKAYTGTSNQNSVENQLSNIKLKLSDLNDNLSDISANVGCLNQDFKMDDQSIELFENAGSVLANINKICKKKSEDVLKAEDITKLMPNDNEKLNNTLLFLEKLGYLKLVYDVSNEKLPVFILILKRKYGKTD
ncbi:hypothetical protein [Methanococcus maripaludis]|uniref:Uncharacterized protein n=1 Tax=Methanococcus maripaludis (strain DSM 14266 / JCM 13030 / NBRC 101832 / S2 / LL) TaxID=267377 RepID=Q6M000_METMP|nr:hypothetical protein [Methanococcus maripaludis]CAF30029.1 hypothetical protein MMP0473 [Methanococcus maripaludis S2]